MRLRGFGLLVLVLLLARCESDSIVRAAEEKADATPQPAPYQDLSSEQLKEIEHAFAAFHGNPVRDDFARLERHIEQLRKTRPASDGMAWPVWFYGNLQSPPQSDSDSWKAHFEKLDRWTAAFPQSPTPLISRGASHIILAWQERGSGYASSVSEAQWALFHDHIERAREALEKASQKQGHDAHLYALLVVVGMAQNDDRETIDEHLAAARKIDPNYYPVYVNIAVSLLPRWGGAPGEVVEFAEQVLQDIPGDQGLEIYARIAAEVCQYDFDYLLNGEFDRQKLAAAMKDICQRYPQAHSLRNFGGAVGWAAQDLELAQMVEETVRQHLNQRVWGNGPLLDLYYKFCALQLAPPKAQRILRFSTAQPKATAISPSGKSLVIASQASLSQALVIRSLADLSVVAELPVSYPVPQNVAIDRAGKQLAVSFLGPRSPLGALRVYNVGDWNDPRILADPQAQRPDCVRISPDGKLLVVAYANQNVGWWDLETGTLSRLTPAPISMHDLLFSPDGKWLAVRGSRTSILFDAATGEELSRLPLKPAADGMCLNEVLGFMPDGRIIAVGTRQGQSSQSVMLWDRNRKKRQDVVHGISQAIETVSPSGTYLIVKSHDTVDRRLMPRGIQIWSLTSGKMLGEYGVVDSFGYAFSPDEKYLAFAVADRSVRVWDLSQLLPAAE